MHTRKGIYWLASYPKSGNTWCRALLARLLSQGTTLDYLNHMDALLGSMLVVSRRWLNTSLGFDSELLTEDEIDCCRRDVYQWEAKQLSTVIYNKIHDAYTHIKGHGPLIPNEGNLGAIYFIRNPLDVAISLAHHANCPIDWSIHMMNNAEFAMPLPEHRDKQVRQSLLTWSQHVNSWVSVTDIPLLVLRYEDMVATPFDMFRKVLHFLNLPVSDTQLNQLIADTQFNQLQKHENQYGFKEKPAIHGNFFRKGRVGDWQNTLTTSQINKIIDDHYDVMHQFGYIE